MIWRLFSAVSIVWALGFVAFAVTLPRPLVPGMSDVVIVPTGGAGRIARGLDILNRGFASKMFVSGVDPEVRESEFAAEFGVTARVMDCCVVLGQQAVDTQTNAVEAADWVAEQGFTTVRLVTSDWHMRRTYAEFRKVFPPSVSIEQDAIESNPSLPILFLEYHKFLAISLARWLGW